MRAHLLATRAAAHLQAIVGTRGYRVAAIALAAIASTTLPAAAQQASIVQPGYAVVTGFSGLLPGQAPDGADPVDYQAINPDGPSARVVDLTTLGGQGALSDVTKPFTVTASQVGQAFGVTLDRATAPNIYIGASSAYGISIFTPDESGNAKRLRSGAPGAQFVTGQYGPAEQTGGPGSIWKVNGSTGDVTLFANIDSGTGSLAGLGGLTYDSVSKQIFAAERGTGIIYRLALDGTVKGTYDHGAEGRPDAGLAPIGLIPTPPISIESPAFDTDNPATWGFASPARRVYALAVYNKRLFYSVAQGPQIWSAAIGGSGSVSAARVEVEVPSLTDGVEIASISFDSQGRMYLAERGATTGDYAQVQLANDGQSRVLRYVPKAVGDPSPGRWRLAPDVYSEGMPPPYANADGGVALNYGYRQDGTINPAACGATLWATGERLLDPGDGSADFQTVDGLQGNATTLFQPQNIPPSQAWYVDYDDQPGDANFRGYMGAIATIPCAGPVAPPPPPAACPPGSYFQNGQCLLYPTCPPGTQFKNGQCVYPQCPTGYIRQGNQCVPPPQVCPPGSVYYQGQCVPLDCPPGLDRLPNGYCACPPNSTYFNGQCVPPQACPPGSIKLGGVCFCPEGLLFKNGQCAPFSCPPNQILTINGKCEPLNCPQGQTAQNGQCVPINCGPGKEIYQGFCVNKCKLGEVHTPPNGQCKPFGPFPPLCNLNTHDIYKGQCVDKCVFPQIRQKDGSCGLVIKPFPVCDLSTHEMYKGQCVDKCTFPQVRKNDGSCGLVIKPFPLCDLSTHEMYKGQCVDKCTFPQVRKNDGSCGLLIKPFPLCDLSTHEMYKGQCVDKCTFPQVRKNDGSCGLLIKPFPLCDLSTHEMYKGQCVDKCTFPQVRKNDGSCGLLIKPFPLCDLSTHEMYKGQCVDKCTFPQVRKNDGSCGLVIKPFPLCDLSTHEMYKGQCVDKCTFPQVRKNDGSCGLQFKQIDKIPLKPILLPTCQANEEIYKGACVAKCVSPQARLDNGSCGLKVRIPGLQLQLQNP